MTATTPDGPAGDMSAGETAQALLAPPSPGLAMTVRRKIWLAFGVLATITLLLGLAGLNNVVKTGNRVIDSYDKPLASMSYARLALGKFAGEATALDELEAIHDPMARATLGRDIDRLAQLTGNYLRLAVERATSERTARAARDTANDAALWDAARRDVISGLGGSGIHDELARRANTVIADFEILIEVAAEDGLAARQKALRTIEDYRRLAAGATFLALTIGALVALFLSRRMMKPIAEASRAAQRIAMGELDVAIKPGGHDELGELLRAMTVMRDNIRRTVRHEIDARRAAQDGLAIAIESSPACVILVDGTRRIVVANAQAREFFPSLADRLAPGDPFPTELETALNATTGEIGLSDGRWLRLSRKSTADRGFVMVGVDITPLKERESALIAAKEGAEAANQAKTDFLANMSHELRTPLNSVIGFSEMIAAEMLGPVGQAKYKEFASDILFSGRHLLAIINHVLDIAKLQWGKMKVELVPVDLNETVEAAVRMTLPQAQKASVALDLETESGLARVDGDATRLRQVVLNLLSNAIKFTPAGGRVVVAMKHVGEVLELSVSDTGIGMKPEDIPKALEPFNQVDAEIARKYGGTGLGLPLSKLFVELHGGDLAIDSEPGRGTVVTVTLPVSQHYRDLPAMAIANGAISDAA
jgi:signal transduction histidine kinase/HAMP domain-containing protein